MQLDVMRAFRRCCPFHKEIRGEIVVAIRKGAAEWFTFELQRYKNPPITKDTVALNGTRASIIELYTIPPRLLW